MFDIDKFEAAGFEKTMTLEEWEHFNAEVVPKAYVRATPDSVHGTPGSDVTVDFVLQRNAVMLRTERNTQEQAEGGLRTTVHYPEIVILEADEGRISVSCDASDAELILLLAEQLEQTVLAQTPRAPRARSSNGRP